VSQLEIELEEERTNADLLSERITWSREQVRGGGRRLSVCVVLWGKEACEAEDSEQGGDSLPHGAQGEIL
jgi:hypothetical protein